MHAMKSFPTSKEMVKRALNLETLACSQYQHIAYICRAEPSIHEAELIYESTLKRLDYALHKIREHTQTINESSLKKMLKDAGDF